MPDDDFPKRKTPVVLDQNVNTFRTEVVYRAKLQEISNAIYAAFNLDEILMDFKQDMVELVGADRITIYYIDEINRELVSRFKSGDEISEIRIPINSNSLAGYCAVKLKNLNILNVYDRNELYAIDPGLKFDDSWDTRSGYITRQALVSPILFKTAVLGVIQLINRKDGTPFSREDEINTGELAKIIGIAIYKQKKLASSLKTRFDYLLESNLLSRNELNDAIVAARQGEKSIEEIFVQNLKIPKRAIGESLSRYYEMPYIEYHGNMPIPEDLLKDVKTPFMRRNNWVPVWLEEDAVLVAIDNPNDIKRVDEIKALFPNRKIKFGVSLARDIDDIITHFTVDENRQGSIGDILLRLKQEETDLEEESAAVSEESSAVVQLVNKMILDGFHRGASDIHIEPYPNRQNTQVRIRVDGACSIYQTIPYSYKKAVVARLKIMADLDISEKRRPQDGKIQFRKYGGKDIELRVATIPTQSGLEDVVMRILPKGRPLPLAEMGFSRRNHEAFMEAVSYPNGLILVCGPTGSGKTTTLHSALGHINTVDRKIWTAEDPVEITQNGLRQVQVQPKIGYSFANAMRAFLRADPDVIMVGEMRDHETAQMGIEASLTGHLVFSTLHTNSAPETVTRLLDMGMDPFNFADSLVCIMAQRLVRTLCEACKEAYPLSRGEFDELRREYGPETFERNMMLSYDESMILFRARGCPECGNSGYRGRVGIHELLVASDEIKQAIHSRALTTRIREIAVMEGMTTLRQDGIAKVLSGLCNLSEVRKVCIK